MANLSDYKSGAGGAGGPFTERVHNQAYTFTDGDEEGILHTSDDVNPYTWTIPLNATTAFQIGSVFTIFNAGAGDITITAEGAATLTEVGNNLDGDRSIASRSIATIVKVDTDDWVISGGGVTTGSSGGVTPTRAKLYYFSSIQ